MPACSGYFKDTTSGQYSAEKGFPIISYYGRFDDVGMGEMYRFYALFPTLEYPGLFKVRRALWKLSIFCRSTVSRHVLAVVMTALSKLLGL